MKQMKCSKCGRVQQQGKFCLDCGGVLIEVITAGVAFKPIETARASETLKKDIRTWLNRIGVQNSDIQIEAGDGAQVTYLLGGKKYTFRSVMQKTNQNNLAAVEQFLHYRVLGIERGIETAEQAFKGYEALPDPNAYLRHMSEAELRQELKRVHPDTGSGDPARWELLMAEKRRRES